MSSRGPERNYDDVGHGSSLKSVVLAATLVSAMSISAPVTRTADAGNNNGPDRTVVVSDFRESKKSKISKNAPAAVVNREMDAIGARMKMVAEVFDDGSEVAMGEDYQENRAFRRSTNRSSDKVKVEGKAGGASNPHDVSLSKIDRALAEIGDIKAIASLGEDELKAVVSDAVRFVGGHIDPASVLHGVKKPVPKLEHIPATNDSEVLNKLKMVMKEKKYAGDGRVSRNGHYEVKSNGKVKLTSLGVALVDKMQPGLDPDQFAGLIGARLGEFRLGEKEMQVRGMIRDEISVAFEGRDKRRDANIKRKRDTLDKIKMAHFDDVVDGVDAGSISYADAENHDEIEARRSAMGAEVVAKMEEDRRAFEDGYREWIEGKVAASGASQEGAVGFGDHGVDEAALMEEFAELFETDYARQFVRGRMAGEILNDGKGVENLGDYDVVQLGQKMAKQAEA